MGTYKFSIVHKSGQKENNSNIKNFQQFSEIFKKFKKEKIVKM